MQQTESREMAVLRLLPQIRDLADRELQDKVLRIWLEFWEESPHAQLDQAPFSPAFPEERLIPHVRAVTDLSMAMAPILEQHHGISYDRDHLLAACLLHDVSKLVEMAPEGGFTFVGDRYPHAYLAVERARKYGLPENVIHLIATHTPKVQMEPVLPEGDVLHHADFASFAMIKRRHGVR